MRGLWQRGARFYAQLSVEDFSTGEKRVRRVPLVNSEGNPVETIAQAIAELNRLRTQRSDDALPKLGRTPAFADYADAYLAGIKTGRGKKKPGTIAKEESTLALWKNILAESASTRSGRHTLKSWEANRVKPVSKSLSRVHS